MPHLSARLCEATGGSTATTMRASGGALSIRARSIMSRDHRASARSSTIAPSISWRPSRVPPYFSSMARRKSGGRFAALARVVARVTTWAGSAISFFRSASGRGVVVTMTRGHSPRRSPNCSMSQTSCAWRHLAISSHHAASNCGPRRLSGSSAEKTCAMAPLRQTRRRRVASHCGRSHLPCAARTPETPSTITSRASA